MKGDKERKRNKKGVSKGFSDIIKEGSPAEKEDTIKKKIREFKRKGIEIL